MSQCSEDPTGNCSAKKSLKKSKLRRGSGQQLKTKVESQHGDDEKTHKSQKKCLKHHESEANQIARISKIMESLKENQPKELKVKIGGILNVENVSKDENAFYEVAQGRPAKYVGRFVSSEDAKTGPAVLIYVDRVKKQLLLTNNNHVLRHYTKAKKHISIVPNITLRCSVLYVSDDVTIGYVNTVSQKSKGCLAFMASVQNDDVNVGDVIEVTPLRMMQGQFMLCKKRSPSVEGNTGALDAVSDSAVASRTPISQKLSIDGLDTPLKSLFTTFKKTPKSSDQIQSPTHFDAKSPTSFEFESSPTKTSSQKSMSKLLGKKVRFCVKQITPARLLGDVTTTKSNRTFSGVLHAYCLADLPKHNTMTFSGYEIGQVLTCHVMGEAVNSSADQVDFELNERGSSQHHLAGSDYAVGKKVMAYVESYDMKGRCFEAEVARGVKSKILDYLISPRAVEVSDGQDYIGKAISCRVVQATNPLQLRAISTVIDGRTGKNTDVRSGSIITGRIYSILPDALLIRTIKGTAKAHVTNLFDDAIDRPLQQFKINQIVRCYVLDCCVTSIMQLSLKKSHTCVTDSRDLTSVDVTSLSGGELLFGYVKCVTKHGVFISLSPFLDGLAILSCVPPRLVTIDDVKRVLYPGRYVRCYVTTVEGSKVRVSLLKQHIGEDIPEPTRKRTADDPCGPASKIPKITKHTKKEIIKLIQETSIDRNIEVKCSSNVNNDVRNDLVWDWRDDVGVELKAPTSDYESDVEETEELKQLSRKEKLEMAEAEELSVRRREMELMQMKAPQSPTEWERLVNSEPDNSMLWIRYMAFHIHANEIEEARAVAEKAIRVINFRKENEKLNIWVSLLNLENMYGSDVTMEQTLRRALSENEPRKVLSHLANIYTQAGKLDKAKETHELAIKKFRADKDVWLAYMRHLMIDHKQENIQETLERCLKSVEKRKHMEVISKTAQLEFKFGDVEKGRTIFENLLSSFPKRTDIWSIYIEMLVQLQRIDEAREVFNRVTSSSISSKKISSFYKRFVEFEVNYGNAKTIKDAKKKAIDYLNTSAK